VGINRESLLYSHYELGAKKIASPCSLLYSGGDQQRINSHQLPTLLSHRNPMKSLHRRIKEQAEESRSGALQIGPIYIGDSIRLPQTKGVGGA
jgi:hypothetical protein